MFKIRFNGQEKPASSRDSALALAYWKSLRIAETVSVYNPFGNVLAVFVNGVIQ